MCCGPHLQKTRWHPQRLQELIKHGQNKIEQLISNLVCPFQMDHFENHARCVSITVIVHWLNYYNMCLKRQQVIMELMQLLKE